MIGRNVPLERKLIEQRRLLNSLMPHHDPVLSERLNQRISPAATAGFFNTNIATKGQIPDNGSGLSAIFAHHEATKAIESKFS
jgi:hypothetical protein